MTSHDASTFRSANPTGYDRFMGRYAVRLAPQLGERARVAAGQHVLDVGCGPGALTAHLANLVGAENVDAIDPSEPFLAACRERVPGADVRLAPAENLPFPDDTFDAALSQLVVNFMSDPVKGVGEMRRVTRPGGTVTACVWDYGGEMTMLARFWDAARAVDPRRATPLDEARAQAIAAPDSLQGLWQQVGLDEVEIGPLIVTAEYDDFDDIWTPFLAGIGPAGSFIVSSDEAQQAALRDEYRRRLGDPTGPFPLTARAWCVTGRVP